MLSWEVSRSGIIRPRKSPVSKNECYREGHPLRPMLRRKGAASFSEGLFPNEQGNSGGGVLLVPLSATGKDHSRE